MTFSGVFEIVKIIALIIGALVMVTAFVALIVIMIVLLNNFVRERTHYLDANLLKYRLECIYARNANNADFSRAIIKVQHEINSILKDY